MFSAARLRLTLWYLAVLATIVVLLSVALYDVLLRLQQAEAQALGRVMRHGVAQLLARDERALAGQIGVIDLGMLILAALGAYVLAGRARRPTACARWPSARGRRWRWRWMGCCPSRATGSSCARPSPICWTTP